MRLTVQWVCHGHRPFIVPEVIWNLVDHRRSLLLMDHPKHILAAINKSQCLILNPPMEVVIIEVRARNHQVVHDPLEAATLLVTSISTLLYEIRIYGTGMCLRDQVCSHMVANGATQAMLAN